MDYYAYYTIGIVLYNMMHILQHIDSYGVSLFYTLVNPISVVLKPHVLLIY